MQKTKKERKKLRKKNKRKEKDTANKKRVEEPSRGG